MKKIFLPLLSLAAILGSCAKDEGEPARRLALSPVDFSAQIADFKDTRAVKTTWSPGEAIAVFSDVAVKKNGSTSTSSITYTRGATDVEWNSPNENERWYLSDAIRDYNFYAYYPVGVATSYTSVELPNISGQDGTKTLTVLKEENDFMRGAATVNKDDLIARLQMFRVFSIINFNVKLKQDAFSNNTATLTDIKITSTNSLPLVNPDPATKATVNLSTGAVVCPGGLTTMTLHPTSGFALTPTALSIPVKIYPQQSTIQVQFTIGGKTSPVQTLSTTSFIGGRIYNYQIEINADIASSQVGDPFIFDWASINGNALTPIIPN